MLEQKNLKRITILILIISLIYATVYPTIFGLISYAQESEETAQEKETKLLKIEVSDFSKNNMQEETTEYQEKLTLTPTENDGAKSIEIADIKTSIEKNTEDTVENQEENNEENNTKVFYTSTKIDKLQILEAFQTGGNLEITYKTEEKITENEEEIKEQEEKKLEKWEIEAKDGKAIIDRETDTDENGFITVIYPKNTTSISIKLNTDISKIEKFEIVNNKTIEKVEDVNLINTLRTAKDLIVEKDNEKISTQEELVLPIYYTRTFAELGIDKNKLATGVENKINFTITLHTEKEIYDLYKNSYFMIELPKEIKTIDIDEAIILNNTYIENSSMDLTTLENGNKAIVMKLEGTQKEYTSSMQENIQIAISARVTTEGFIPTIQEQINLYYTNENATTYNGVEKGENGFQNTAIELVSNKEVMVDSKVLFGDNSISSRENQNTIVMKPNSYENVTIIGTAINNVGTDIQNAKILGTATNMGPISGVEKVYYTENPDANTNVDDANNKWTETYTANAKKFLIVLDEFKQAQTVTFGYYMYLPQNAEEDTELEASFEVYNNENQNINASTIKTLQEAKESNIYENSKIKANIVCSNTENIEVGDYIDCGVLIENISEEEIKNISIKATIPNNFEKAITMLTINGEQIGTPSVNDKNEIQIQDTNLKKGETLLLGIRIKVLDYVNKIENFKANITCDNQEAIEIFERLNIVEKSQIETTITSNKVGQKLEPKEDIEYKATLKNTGKSHATIDITTAIPETINITKIKTVNQVSGEIRIISGNGLKNGINKVTINPNETIEVYIKGIVKDIKQDDYAEMYIKVAGDKVIETTTSELINKINKKEQVVESYQASNSNTIKGIAWLDENENGQKDENEMILIGAQVVLIDTKNSKEVATKTTNSKGEYTFRDIPEGSYVIEFRYNKNNFTVTDYTKTENSKGLNSNVISTTQSNETIAKTEVMKLQAGETQNINAGFVMNKKFDISIKEELTQITINNEQGIKTYDYNNLKTSKIEIDEKYAKNAVIVAQYEITVSNIGEVEGSVYLVSDKLPEGMKFSSELNTDWYEGEDGNIYSVALSSKKIKPGEQEKLKIVLTKENVDDSMQSIVLENNAKILETSNAYLLQDSNLDNNLSNSIKTITLVNNKEGRD